MSGKVETKRDMRNAGYKFLGTGACKGCSAPIEWWKTTNGRNMPFDGNPSSELFGDHVTVSPHWATCPKRDQFKSKADVAAQNKADREKRVGALLDGTRARAVVALYDDGVTALSWRNGIPGEDLKHELITAANRLRYLVDMKFGGGR